jgi:ion channel
MSFVNKIVKPVPSPPLETLIWKFKWAILYLFLLMAVYPCIYDWFLADDFYHSSSKYEYNLIKDQKRLEQALQQTISSKFKANFQNLVLNSKQEFEFENWKMSRDQTVSVSALSVDDNQIDPRVSFQYSFTVTEAKPSAIPEMPPTMEKPDNLNRNGLGVGFSERAEASFVAPLDAAEFREREVDISRPKTRIFRSVSEQDQVPIVFYEAFFPSKENSRVLYRGGAWLELPKDLWNDLKTWINGMQGHPSHSSGEWMRMFYLSATVMTTIGFGDIVPITPLARGWVASQAIVGAILVGLFLNDLLSSGASIMAGQAVVRWVKYSGIGLILLTLAFVAWELSQGR